MFLPYETLVSFWSIASPLYQWEPVEPAPEPDPPADAEAAAQAPAAPDDAESATGTPAACRPPSLPTLRLVFKGLKWSTDPVYSFRENLGWSDAASFRRETDDAQRDLSHREERRQPVKPKPKTDWESP